MVLVFLPIQGISPLAGQTDILKEHLQVRQCVFRQWLDIHLFPLFDYFPVGIGGQESFASTGAVQGRTVADTGIYGKGHSLFSDALKA